MRGCFAVVLLSGCFDPAFPTGAACSLAEPCPDRQSCIDGSCQGNIEVEDGEIIAIQAAGVWGSASSELRRTLGTETSRTTFTFSTWYLSNNSSSMPLCAGVSASEQTFVWADANDPAGLPYFQHVDRAAGPAMSAWPYFDRWTHLVLAVDTTQDTFEKRVKWWVDGRPQSIQISDSAGELPQGMELYLGQQVLHTIGNKHDGDYNWTGSLAETYVIWGHQLDASAFVATTPAGVRSIPYTGPVEAESVYFNYVTPGENLFAAQPAWIATSMSSTTMNLPY